MIKKIVIRDVASYDHEGVTFDDLAKVNFIYGGNGTGKTTFSRVLAHPNDFPSCKVEWEGKPVEVVVFNQDFKRDNLKEVMPGVFTIGFEHFRETPHAWFLGKKIGRLEEKAGDETAMAELERLKNEREEILSKTMSLQPTVDNINKMLQQMGFTGFRIQPSPLGNNEFQIQREDGSYVKDTLSEGEETIITFLYFIQVVTGFLVQGEKNTCKKVVVIDDPISSLDYDAIDLVSTMTNDLIKKARKGEENIEQVIVLTHNTTYHKSLCVNQPRKSTRYWTLYKRKGVSKARAYGEDNPVRGEYEELWAKLRALRDDATDFKVALPNLMRRIIETYFVEYGGFERHKLFAGGYVKKKEEKQAVVALMKWIDEGSHCVRDINVCGDFDDSGERFFNLFEKTFEAMGHEAHYRMMMREA